MSEKIEPTYTSHDVCELLQKSLAWLSLAANKHSIGHKKRSAWHFTRRDVTALKRLAAKTRMGNPNWLPGKSQPHRKVKK